MIEQFQQPKEHYTKEELKDILELSGKGLEDNLSELSRALLEEQQKEGLSNEEIILRAMLLAKKIILIDIKQAIDASEFEA